MTRKEIDNQKWWNNFELAKQYYIEFDNLLIPQRYKVNGVSLGAWIAYQRKLYEKGQLSQDKIDALNIVGMVWSIRKKGLSWEDAYEIACIYRNEYGHLLVPDNFIFHDFNLGLWIKNKKV